MPFVKAFIGVYSMVIFNFILNFNEYWLESKFVLLYVTKRALLTGTYRDYAKFDSPTTLVDLFSNQLRFAILYALYSS